MKRAFFISVLFVFVMCFASSQSYGQSEWTGNINILGLLPSEWVKTVIKYY